MGILSFIWEKKMIIEKKIRALADLDLKTSLGLRTLVKGEVITFPFKNNKELEAILSLGSIELVVDEVEEKKEIPVIPKDPDIPSENELLNQLELTGNLDKLKKENPKEIKPENEVVVEKREFVREEEPCTETAAESTEETLVKISGENPKEVWNSKDGYKKDVNRS